MAIPGAAPARLGRYELLARLAAGGMGEIFLARLEGAAGFEKLYVIKRILPHMADDARFRAMLIAEARIASMMTHANICQVYELGETSGQLYIAMEYLEGVTLLPLLRRLSKDGGALALGFVAGVIQQATDALHYAHELRDRGGDNLGVVHRDVTPTNLFLTDAGVVKVLDFGIAKVKDISAHTQTGTVKGKYAYMAPEQLRGAAIDRRADVFALGVVVYEMLALRRLFQRKTDYLTFRAVMEQPIIDIRRYRPDCPDALAAVLARALERDPASRFDTARQFGSAVLDAVAATCRPWSHGEISDFVRGKFADDLAQRSAQIAQAVSSGGGRAAMPLILQSDEEVTEVDDAQEFPAVSSEVSETPVDMRHLREPSTEQAVVSEPGAPGPPGPAPGSPGPGASVGPDAMRASQPLPPSVVVVNQRRSVVWPMVAFAMVAVAGGALFLVWRQMQNQPPTSLVITRDPGTAVTQGGSNVVIVGRDTADRGPGSPSDPAGSAEAPGSGAGAPVLSGSDGGGRARPVRPPERRSAVNLKDRAGVELMQPGVTRCATDHGKPPPGTRVVIAIAPDGHARRVTIVPQSVDDGPLGACIRNVVKTVTFSHVDHELEVKLVQPA
ncbi:MAG TPA: protein kinase [Kofleriaceae bacterium]